MSKIEEFEACDRFMSEAQFFLPIDQRRFVLLEHRVDQDAFVIIANYEKHMFEHKINEFLRDLIKEAQNTDLYRYDWAVYRPLCEKIMDPKSYFLNSVVVTITAN